MPLFLKKQSIGLGWGEIGNLKNKSKSEIKADLLKVFTDRQKSVPIWAGMLDAFVNVIKQGDYVISYDIPSRSYAIAQVVGEYKFEPGKMQDMPNVRRVKWLEETVSRDLLSVTAKNSLGATMTLFKVSKDIENEFTKILNGDRTEKTEQEQEQETKIQSEELFENSTEVLKDRISALSPDNMEELLKEILIAMGYIATRSVKGADRGVDVFASKDGLGLEEPRIFAEVKHRKGQIGSQEIRTFVGGRQAGDKCLYVSTGGFSKDAKYEAERSKIALTLVDLNVLAFLITLHYDNFSAEGKVLLPLKKIYLPI